MQERKLSCDLTPIKSTVDCEGNKISTGVGKDNSYFNDGVLRNNDGTAVPAEKIAEMQLYAQKLRKSSPGMKESRVARKVAEKFKVKLT